jgi:hypothetical protein
MHADQGGEPWVIAARELEFVKFLVQPKDGPEILAVDGFGMARGDIV